MRNKIATSLMLCFLVLNSSCKSDRDRNIDNLERNISILNNLIFTIENDYRDKFIIKEKNRIIFSTNRDTGIKFDDFIIDEKIITEMNNLNIQQIRFEKIESSCNGNFGYTEVYFKLEKSFWEETTYYLFEYCENLGEYHSATIFFQPINKNWGLYIESN